MEESDTGLEEESVSLNGLKRRSREPCTYSEDHQAADNGGVLGVGGLVIDGAEHALVGASVLGEGDTVGGHCCGGYGDGGGGGNVVGVVDGRC